MLGSNGAINLSPRKACVLKEAFRVLKPGGRFYIADIVRDAAEPHPTPNTAEPPGSWANCVAGTVTAASFLAMLVVTGFVDPECLGTTGYHTSAETVGATFSARKRARRG